VLQSGATIKSVVTALEEIGADFVTRCTDQVASVAKDAEAFALIQQTVENFLRYISGTVEDAAKKASGVPRAAVKFHGIFTAGDNLFNESRTHLLRQLEIQRFTFTVPQARPMLTPARAPSPDASNQRNRGGKPLADHWDQMWAAIAVMLYLGDLKPKTQADIERAMKDWLSAHEFDAGDTAVRGRARKLWQELLRSE
jgi:hypothetical protein